MDKELINKVEVVLRELAAQLGTTAEYLWTVLVKQAVVESIYGVVIWLLFLTIFSTCLKYLSKNFTRGFVNSKEPDPFIFTLVIFCLVAGGISLLSMLVGVACIGDIVTGFINPEYYALTQILEKL